MDHKTTLPGKQNNFVNPASRDKNGNAVEYFMQYDTGKKYGQKKVARQNRFDHSSCRRTEKKNDENTQRENEEWGVHYFQYSKLPQDLRI